LKKTNKVNLASANNIERVDDWSQKTFKEISDSVNCDKTTYHVYDRYYPMFLDRWRNQEINIFEIGIDEGKSLNIWNRYFPKARVWGMDISKSYDLPNCKVFIGDQSKLEDLTIIQKQVPRCKVIVDDGSHVAEHQLKSFHFLFDTMLDWGGVYIIEDIECSYWKPNNSVYSFETGYLNIVDYFTTLNHKVNSHYNNMNNELHIKSITYGSNCIIIQKKELTEIKEKEYRFKSMLPYSNSVGRITNNISVNFIDGAFVEITGNDNEKYNIKFIDKSNNSVVFQTKIQNNQWARVDRKWFTDWKIEIIADGKEPIVYEYNATNKRVLISLESSSLGDTLAWIPYVEEFRKKHNSKVIVSTFLNQLFEKQYPELEFVQPGTSVHDLYAIYRIGCFYDETGIDFKRHKSNFLKLKLQEYATDILGLPFQEIRPLVQKSEPIKTDRPYICIANHSTSQAKYWNNSTGWQELVDYVKNKGYDVYLLSREEDGYMGNKNPDGVIKISNKNLFEIGSILLGSSGFVGIGSGLTWYAWSLNVPTILISGFSEPYQEMGDVYRVINTDVCHGCFARHLFDRGDWNWCPDHKGTERQFECSKTIRFLDIKPHIDDMISIIS